MSTFALDEINQTQRRYHNKLVIIVALNMYIMSPSNIQAP
jgi:hypothetical protein